MDFQTLREFTLGFGVFVSVPEEYRTGQNAVHVQLIELKDASRIGYMNAPGFPEMKGEGGFAKRVVFNLDIYRGQSSSPNEFSETEPGIDVYIFAKEDREPSVRPSLYHWIGVLPPPSGQKPDPKSTREQQGTWFEHDYLSSVDVLKVYGSHLKVGPIREVGPEGLYQFTIYAWPANDQMVCVDG